MQLTPVHYNPEDIEVLRTRTEDLCAKLDELHAALKNRLLTLNDLKVDFEQIYQPEAVALAEAMSYHLPDQDSRLAGVGGARVFTEMATLSEPLRFATQLNTIADFLRHLAASLPERPIS